jgi:dihydrofolate reductase
MRRIINSTYISLDGVITNPQDWPSDDFDEASVTIQTELLDSCDAVLMGRHTYEAFAPAWSSRSGDPYSERMNSMTKYAVSTTLQDPQWNNTTVISDDLAGRIKELKNEPGQDIVQYGFGAVSYALMAEGLLDELRLWVHPFFVGAGGPEDLLFQAASITRLQMVDSRTLSNGIIILRYEFS